MSSFLLKPPWFGSLVRWENAPSPFAAMVAVCTSLPEKTWHINTTDKSAAIPLTMVAGDRSSPVSLTGEAKVASDLYALDSVLSTMFSSFKL